MYIIRRWGRWGRWGRWHVYTNRPKTHKMSRIADSVGICLIADSGRIRKFVNLFIFWQNSAICSFFYFPADSGRIRQIPA